MTMNSQMPPAGLSVDTCSLLEVLVVVGAVGDGSREGLHHPPLKGSLADPGSQVSTQAPVDSPPKAGQIGRERERVSVCVCLCVYIYTHTHHMSPGYSARCGS